VSSRTNVEDSWQSPLPTWIFVKWIVSQEMGTASSCEYDIVMLLIKSLSLNP
jgi:hypothetical protein